MQKEKFASQADSEVLMAMRAIAESEGKQFQAVLDEAMRDFIEKRRNGKPRSHVMSAFADSLKEFDELYKKLAQ